MRLLWCGRPAREFSEAGGTQRCVDKAWASRFDPIVGWVWTQPPFRVTSGDGWVQTQPTKEIFLTAQLLSIRRSGLCRLGNFGMRRAVRDDDRTGAARVDAEVAGASLPVSQDDQARGALGVVEVRWVWPQTTRSARPARVSA